MNTSYVAPLDVAEFSKVFTPNEISKANYDIVVAQVSARFSYVFETLMEMQGRKYDWYDFENEAGEYSPGYFDPVEYKENISFTGSIKRSVDDLYYDSFPTKWLTNNFEAELLQEIEKAKQAIKDSEFKKKEAANKKIEIKNKMQSQIKSKLSKEELAYIKFI